MIYLLGCLLVAVMFLCVYFSGMGSSWMYKLKEKNGKLLLAVIVGMIALSWLTIIVFVIYYLWKQYVK